MWFDSKKILSIFLMILVLFSSTSFIIRKYKCIEEQQAATQVQKKCCTEERNCCTSSTIIIKKDASSVDFIVTDFSFSFHPLGLVQSLTSYFKLSLEEIHNEKEIIYIHFYPPDLKQKTYILYETFLI